MLPVFAASISEIDPDTQARMTPTSWREGCPVGFDELRLIRVVHFDDGGELQDGELVVHREHADAMVEVFRQLFEARFPIHEMRLVDDYDGSDQLSMQANNTSAFNCREVAYTPGRWSNHAFGGAIDINPLVNPYVQGDFVDPAQATEYVDRSRTDVVGYITADSVVVQAFASVGWTWGGNWSSAKDYQHFSASGT